MLILISSFFVSALVRSGLSGAPAMEAVLAAEVQGTLKTAEKETLRSTLLVTTKV